MNLHFSKEALRKRISEELNADVSAGKAMSRKRFAEEFLDTDADLISELFPWREILKRGWFDASLEDVKKNSSEMLSQFLSPLGSDANHVYCKRTINEHTQSLTNHYSMIAWTARVLLRAETECCAGEYVKDNLHKEFFTEIAQLSYYSDGPRVAVDYLSDRGIAVIVEPHLPGTRLDGMATLSKAGNPVIGLTLRYDRIDNFWFTLLHELVHVMLHLNDEGISYVDDLDDEGSSQEERQANRYARDALIPRSIWRRSDAYRYKTNESIVDLAEELHIHPAIIAGRIQRDLGNYRILREYLDSESVRSLFDGIQWS
jgi:HTH-type transcriptional regulator/antitoxin HigA